MFLVNGRADGCTGVAEAVKQSFFRDFEVQAGISGFTALIPLVDRLFNGSSPQLALKTKIRCGLQGALWSSGIEPHSGLDQAGPDGLTNKKDSQGQSIACPAVYDIRRRNV
ncbi:MAG: hypothetical protein U9P10_06440 [Thermodesulfobacteriota bacterium]|nr:hypothetical protein [Thermodesulfobacteriota bacterium]